MKKKTIWFLAGVALGGAATYFFDPQHGRKRRSLLRDQAESLQNDLSHYLQSFGLDFGGVLQGAKSLDVFQGQRATDDGTLIERVRSELGHVIEHPRSIDVSVVDGVVTLSGPLLGMVASDVIKRVKRVAGVREVVDHLLVYENADSISTSQGEGKLQ